MNKIRSLNTTFRRILSITFLVLGILVFLTGLYVDRVITLESLRTLHIKNVPANVEHLKTSIPSLFTVMSGSMEPTIKTASVILTLPKSEYQTGDIISFTPTSDKEYVVTHRIISKEARDGQYVYTTSGDANDTIDGWDIYSKDIVGNVRFTTPYLGYVTQFAKTPKGFILLVIVPATIIIYEELKTLAIESKKQFFKLFGSKSKKKDEEIRPDPSIAVQDTGASFTLPKASVLLPVIGVGLLIVSASVSFFSDREISLNNMASAAAANDILINEFVAGPEATFSTEWVELYNASDTPVDLTGWTLTNGIDTPRDLTSLGIIPAGAFVIYEEAGPWLTGSSASLSLIRPDATVSDTHSYTVIPADTARGREMDGAQPFKDCVIPTFGTSNNTSC